MRARAVLLRLLYFQDSRLSSSAYDLCSRQWDFTDCYCFGFCLGVVDVFSCVRTVGRLCLEALAGNA